MATTISDDFNRADGGLGANWVTASGTPLIVATSYFGTTTADPNNPAFAKYNTPLTSNDHDITSVVNVAGGHAAGYYTRCLSGASAAQGYGCECRQNALGLLVSVMRLTAGVATYLLFEQQSGIGTTAGVDHNLRMTISGSQITIYLDGVYQTTQTDTTYPTGNYVMLGTEYNDSGHNSFVASDIVPARPQPLINLAAITRAGRW